MRSTIAILVVLCFPFAGNTQYYHAANGSSYIGSLNVHNNPASIVNAPFKWDLTIFGIQDKHSTNIVDISNYSLLSNPANSEYAISPGDYKRKGDANVNLNLFNFRLALSPRSAIALGFNFKSYTRVRSSKYNFVDTLGSFRDFFVLNENNRDLSVDLASGSWSEFYFSYGQTIIDNDRLRLNGGATLKLNKGLSGAFAKVNGSFSRTGSLPETYQVNSADMDFSYSANYDQWDNSKSFNTNFRNFSAGTRTGFSADMGLELLIKRPFNTNRELEEGFFDYDWKIGVSLLDLGYSAYQHGKYNTQVRNLRPGVTNQLLDQKFDSSVTSFGQFRDSLVSLYQTARQYTGDFKIIHPARVVINVDKFIDDAFFVNADLSIGVASLIPVESRSLRDLSLLTVTPRWETRRKGFYMPIQYSSANQLWIGGAVRLGPVLFGIHNFANLFSKKKMQRGIGYLAIILKASDITGEKADKRLDCYW
ncbi:MAG: hypothetical protein EOO01_04290 [Chitinophagaceae bacterium]|nr:MAG: hypothetical protein EOO01_04290 [Chitinophagaceae bacterium]